MDDSTVIYWFAAPFMAVGALVVIERFALLAGVRAAHRFGLPHGSWTETLRAEVPKSVAPSSFPAVDNLAPGTDFDRSNRVETRWLDDSTISVWDRQSNGGVNRASLLVTALLTIDRSRGAAGSILQVQPRYRITPWLTLPAVFISMLALERTWWSTVDDPMFLAFKWVAVLLFGGILLAQAIAAHGRLPRIVSEVAAELQHRAQTGAPTVEGGAPATALGSSPLDDL